MYRRSSNTKLLLDLEIWARNISALVANCQSVPEPLTNDLRPVSIAGHPLEKRFFLSTKIPFDVQLLVFLSTVKERAAEIHPWFWYLCDVHYRWAGHRHRRYTWLAWKDVLCNHLLAELNSILKNCWGRSLNLLRNNSNFKRVKRECGMAKKGESSKSICLLLKRISGVSMTKLKRS